ncbi:hypothetical protein OROMI_012635 [Orobanche minor]
MPPAPSRRDTHPVSSGGPAILRWIEARNISSELKPENICTECIASRRLPFFGMFGYGDLFHVCNKLKTALMLALCKQLHDKYSLVAVLTPEALNLSNLWTQLMLHKLNI